MKKKFIEIYIDLYATILKTAVKREANVDLKLKNNIEKQEELEKYIFGMIIVSFHSYIESNHGKFSYDKKNEKGTLGNKIINDTCLIDTLIIFKYYRDVFAHNFEGKMFSEDKKNTKNFIDAYSRGNNFFNNNSIKYEKEYLLRTNNFINDLKKIYLKYIIDIE